MRVHLILLLVLLLPSSLAVAQSRPDSAASRPVNVVVSAATWAPDAIKVDPAGFIACAIPRLRANITVAETAQNGLREASVKLDRLKQENRDKLASSAAALDAFREAFQASGRRWPLSVAGREYDEPAFMKEVDRLLEDRSLLSAVGNQIALASEETDRKAGYLAMDIKIDRVTIDTLEASKSMLAKPLSSTVERIIESTRKRLSEVEKSRDPPAIPSVAELMHAASRKSRLASAEFLSKSRLTAAEFLSRKPESRK
jgi:hypothetical protein